MSYASIVVAGGECSGKTALAAVLGRDPASTTAPGLPSNNLRASPIDFQLPDGSWAVLLDIQGAVSHGASHLDEFIAAAFMADVALVVVSAVEGVASSLREQVEVLRLIGIGTGVIAISKCDLTDREACDRVEAEIRVLTTESQFQSLPVIRISSPTGRGINALKRALLAAIRRSTPRPTSEPVRLVVSDVIATAPNRVTAKVFIRSGSLHTNDLLEVARTRAIGRVRGVRLHGKREVSAFAGSHPIVDIEMSDHITIIPKLQLAALGVLQPAKIIDAELFVFAADTSTIQDESIAVVYFGSETVSARIEVLAPPDTALDVDPPLVRLHCAEPITFRTGDRIVLRITSPFQTIVGGRLRHSAADPQAVLDADSESLLRIRADHRIDRDIEEKLFRSPSGAERRRLMEAHAGEETPETTAAIQRLESANVLVRIGGGLLMHRIWLDTLTDRVVERLGRYHERYPTRTGMPLQELAPLLGSLIEPLALKTFFSYLARLQTIKIEGDIIRTGDFRVGLNPRQFALLGRIEEEYRRSGAASVPIQRIGRLVKAPPNAVETLVRMGVERGALIEIAVGTYWHIDTITQVQNVIRGYVAQHGGITASALRDITSTNRNTAVAALEYCDLVGFTTRTGDVRTLAPSKVHGET